LSRANAVSWGRLIGASGTWSKPHHMFIHPMSISSQCQRFHLRFKSEASSCSSFVCSQISWNNAISSCTISYTALICTTTKKNDISDKLSNGGMSLSYVTSISSSLISLWISCPLNKRWPSCFNISTIFHQTEWYSPILIFLMDALLLPWSG
jgi:hypothetical protein